MSPDQRLASAEGIISKELEAVLIDHRAPAEAGIDSNVEPTHGRLVPGRR